MYRFILIMTITLLSTNAWGNETYNVNWPKLEAAVASFMQNPNTQAADHIEQQLPPGKHASHSSDAFDSEAATRIFSNIRPLIALIDNGNSDAVRVAYAFTEISDGEYSSWLSEILASAAAKHPHAFLLGVKQRMGNQSPPCSDIAMMKYGFEGDHVKILKVRLDAIQSVSDPALENEKACSVKVLKKAMKEPPLW